MRIAIGGFQHESHSFAPRPAEWADFVQPGGWPALQRPATLVATLRPTSVPAAGAIAEAEAQGMAIAPLSWALANPSGPVAAGAFERMAALILSDLQAAMAAGKLDGVYLDLHGAMVAEGFPDAEGEILRRTRAVVGPGVPLVASLDPHCNLTAAMVAHADALVPYRTYPHVDMPATGARAVRLLRTRAELGRPFARAHRAWDVLIPITAQCTLVPPMRDAMAARAEIAARHGVAELGLCFGFPYADFPGCGPAIAAYAEDEGAARAAAGEMLDWLAAHEADFATPILPAAEGVARALRPRAGSAPGPVVLADTQDNPGGGGHGDTTGLLAELVRQGAAGAVVASINDPRSAAACHAAGEGAVLRLALGGRSDGVPFEAEWRVLRLSDGRFTCTGPMAGGNPADLGPSALVETAGVRVILASRKMQAYDQALLRHLGVEPATAPILALKSSVHFRADFEPIASEVLVVAAPGPVVADPATLPFRHLRPGMRLRPGANDRFGG